MGISNHSPVQRIIKVRRDYNTWVANETLEDYALRFTPRSFRKWSELRVANTAFGAASFLVLEAVGATMLVNGGFLNSFLAILATGLIIIDVYKRQKAGGARGWALGQPEGGCSKLALRSGVAWVATSIGRGGGLSSVGSAASWLARQKEQWLVLLSLIHI